MTKIRSIPVAGVLSVAALALSGCEPSAGSGGPMPVSAAATTAASPASTAPGPATGVASASASPGAGGLADLWPCKEVVPLRPPARESWRHKRSALVAASGDPGHAAADVVAPVLGGIELAGKFAYGKLSKDLEDERVRAFIHGCDGWVAVGDATTDDDGRASARVKLRPAPGEYPFRMVVLADGSVASGVLWVRPAGTRVHVFDVDGTLTVRDEELFDDLMGELMSEDYVPEEYPGGVALTAARAAGGDLVIYITGRPYLLADMTRGWLRELGYSRGPLFLTSSTAELATTTSGVGDYKLRTLQRLQKDGFVIASAHGNALTDVYAYTKAGIPAEAIWIIGEHGGADGTRAVKDSWEPVVKAISASD